jgi:hypothetical protein
MTALLARVREVLRTMRLAQLELCIRHNDRSIAMHRFAMYAAIRARDEALAAHVIETYAEPDVIPAWLLKPAANIQPIRRKHGA